MFIRNPVAIIGLRSEDGFVPREYTGEGWRAEGRSHYADYILNQLYSREYDVGRLALLAAHAISETSRIDPNVGGPVQVATITSAGYEALSRERVVSLEKANADFQSQVVALFRRRVSPPPTNGKPREEGPR